MCQSKADGGKRCYAHAKSALEKAQASFDGSPESLERRDNARVMFARTEKGRSEVRDFVANASEEDKAAWKNALQQAQAANEVDRLAQLAQQPLWVTLDPSTVRHMNFANSGVDYEYDYYGPDQYSGCECDDLCRCSVYEGLRVTKVNPSHVAAAMLGVEPRDPRAQSHIQQAIKELDLGNPKAYEIRGESDYYGESAVAGFADWARAEQWLTDFAAENPNIVRDEHGARPYIAAKGGTVTGDDVADMRAVLVAEHGEKVAALVEGKTVLWLQPSIPFNTISTPDMGRVETEAVVPRTPRDGSNDTLIHGTVAVAEDGSLVLVDGYARMLGARGKTGNFFFLA